MPEVLIDDCFFATTDDKLRVVALLALVEERASSPEIAMLARLGAGKDKQWKIEHLHAGIRGYAYSKRYYLVYPGGRCHLGRCVTYQTFYSIKRAAEYLGWDFDEVSC